MPKTSTDTEQIISMAAAFGLINVDINLFCPTLWIGKNSTLQAIADYYGVPAKFNLHYIKAYPPFLIFFKKLSHAYFASQAIKDSHPNAIGYTRNIPALITLLRVSKVPVIFETYRPWPDQNIAAARYFGSIADKPNFLGIVAHSEYAADSYKKVGVPPDKIIVAYNGIWPDRFADDVSKINAREELGAAANALIATYTGRVNTGKGLRRIFLLAKKFPEVTFWIVGSEVIGEIEKEARKYANITIFPWLPPEQVTQYLHASDILIIPPSSKPLKEVGNTVLPMKTFNYMAAKRAIFAPDNPDLQELLTDEHNAVLADPSDSKDIVKQFGKLVSDSTLRTNIAEQAYHDIDSFSWQKRAGKIIDFIQSRLNAWL